MVFYIYTKEKENKREKERFREYVLATKARTIEQYSNVLVEDDVLEQAPQDELVELDQTDPGELLTAIKQNENN
jgi:hypothetical protein